MALNIQRLVIKLLPRSRRNVAFLLYTALSSCKRVTKMAPAGGKLARSLFYIWCRCITKQSELILFSNTPPFTDPHLQHMLNVSVARQGLKKKKNRSKMQFQLGPKAKTKEMYPYYRILVSFFHSNETLLLSAVECMCVCLRDVI